MYRSSELAVDFDGNCCFPSEVVDIAIFIFQNPVEFVQVLLENCREVRIFLSAKTMLHGFKNFFSGFKTEIVSLSKPFS